MCRTLGPLFFFRERNPSYAWNDETNARALNYSPAVHCVGNRRRHATVVFSQGGILKDLQHRAKVLGEFEQKCCKLRMVLK